MLSDREREFRLRPRKPPAAKRSNEIGAWSVLYKAVMRHARMTRKAKTRGKAAASGSRSSRRFRQRCAVRVMYSRNVVRGQWGAHGRYVARESAARGDGDRAGGFDNRADSVAIAQRLDGWQRAGDERIWIGTDMHCAYTVISSSAECVKSPRISAHGNSATARRWSQRSRTLRGESISVHSTGSRHQRIGTEGRGRRGRQLPAIQCVPRATPAAKAAPRCTSSTFCKG